MYNNQSSLSLKNQLYLVLTVLHNKIMETHLLNVQILMFNFKNPRHICRSDTNIVNIKRIIIIKRCK